jgi:hypothetical protein
MDAPDWQRFSPTFRRVIDLAHEEAVQAGAAVDDDYLLAGLLIEGESDAARLVFARGVSLEQVLASLPRDGAPSASRGRGPRQPGDFVNDESISQGQDWQVTLGDGVGHAPLTKSAQRVIGFASDESIYHGGQVSAEHLLLGLIRNDGSAAGLLRAAVGLRADLVALLALRPGAVLGTGSPDVRLR